MVEDGTAIGSAIASAANRLKDKEAKSKLWSCLPMGTTTRAVSPRLPRPKRPRLSGFESTPSAPARTERCHFLSAILLDRTVYRNVHMEYNDDLLKQIASISKGKYFRAADTAYVERGLQ